MEKLLKGSKLYLLGNLRKVLLLDFSFQKEFLEGLKKAIGDFRKELYEGNPGGELLEITPGGHPKGTPWDLPKRIPRGSLEGSPEAFSGRTP